MMKKHGLQRSLLLGVGLALVACSPQAATQKSHLDGHYEDSDEATLTQFAGKQTAVAEYTPSQGVIVSLKLLTDYQHHEMAADIVRAGVETLWVTVPSKYSASSDTPDFATLRSLLGSDFAKVVIVKQKDAGPITVWSRDWAPLSAKTKDGELRLLDFNYYSDRGADDSTARSLLPLFPVERVSIPVYNEGGNFMVNQDGVCLMTSRVSDANAETERDDDLVLDEEEIADYYKTYAGCTDVQIFPRMPYEGTGHIDMWAKFLDNETIIVGEIRDAIVSLDSYSSSDKRKVQSLQKYLNERADDLKTMGFTVIRIPMPAPIFDKMGQDTFRSYTNSLTLNGVALVPRYIIPAENLGTHGTYSDAEFLAAYETEVEQIYLAAGYRFKWVASDTMIADGGAVHCTTMQIAK